MIIALRDGKKAVTLGVSSRSAGAVAALVSAAIASEDAGSHAVAFEAECSIDGELEISETR